mgnify:CR=1 FL=1
MVVLYLLLNDRRRAGVDFAHDRILDARQYTHPGADRRKPRHRPCDREEVQRRRLARDHRVAPAFQRSCPWPGGDKNHVQIDLADLRRCRAAASTRSAPGWAAGGSTRWSTTRRSRPRTRPVAGSAPSTRRSTCWQQRVQRQFLRAGGARPRPDEELSEARGCVVNVTSIAGSRVHPFAGSAYATSKAALAALTREMAHDFGPRGIRVNAIAPGEIDTAILSPGTDKIVEEQIPMRRLGTPDEVADVIHFLCEKGASLCERRRDPDQRRPARVAGVTAMDTTITSTQGRDRPRRAPPHPRRQPIVVPTSRHGAGLRAGQPRHPAQGAAPPTSARFCQLNPKPCPLLAAVRAGRSAPADARRGSRHPHRHPALPRLAERRADRGGRPTSRKCGATTW